jgi:signal transduction histidine kinase
VTETKPSAKTRLSGLIEKIAGTRRIRADKERAEAFLDSAPFAYCGWTPDGTLAYNAAFCKILGVSEVRTLADVQARLATGDAAALEGLFERLVKEERPFTLTARNFDGLRTLELHGAVGRDPEKKERFDVLWLEDVTAQTRRKDHLEEAARRFEADGKRLGAILDRLPVPVWTRDSGAALTWCNRAYAAATDVTPATAIAEQRELPATATGRKNAAATGSVPVKTLAVQALNTGQTREAAIHIIASGRRRLVQVSEVPVPESDASTKGTVGIARDITREEELETGLRRSSMAYRELMEHLRSAIAIYGADQKLEFYNTAFAQMWDLDAPFLDARPKLGDVMEKLREMRRLPEQADFRKYKQSWVGMFTSLIDPHEDMLHLPDGKAVRMLALPHPMGGLMMTFEDVTDRLALESSYNTLIAVQKETLDNLAEGIAVVGGDGRIKLWNPALARMWTLNPEDLGSEPHITRLLDKVKGLFPSADWTARRETLLALGLERKERKGRMTRADGSVLDYATVPLPDGGMLVSWSDVSDTVKVEKALRDKNAALETADRLKLDFLANVSYQLRTPLNAIMGFSEILDKEYFGPLNLRQKDYTKGIGEAGGKLMALINDILDLSTIEAGYMALERAPVNLVETLKGLVTLTKEWTEKEKIALSVECPANPGPVMADERRLKQVVLNLIRNAISFTPQGGKITLSLRRTDTGVDLAVSDTGIGIPAQDQKRVFEPFERAAPGPVGGAGEGKTGEARTGRTGAGLGLALVRNIVALHGGSVDLTSAPGKGTTVTLHLPREAAVASKP